MGTKTKGPTKYGGTKTKTPPKTKAKKPARIKGTGGLTGQAGKAAKAIVNSAKKRGNP